MPYNTLAVYLYLIGNVTCVTITRNMLLRVRSLEPSGTGIADTLSENITGNSRKSAPGLGLRNTETELIKQFLASGRPSLLYPPAGLAAPAGVNAPLHSVCLP